MDTASATAAARHARAETQAAPAKAANEHSEEAAAADELLNALVLEREPRLAQARYMGGRADADTCLWRGEEWRGKLAEAATRETREEAALMVARYFHIDEVRAAMAETQRVMAVAKVSLPIFPYIWPSWEDQGGGFLDPATLEMLLSAIVREGGDGVVVWGAKTDALDAAKCDAFERFLNASLGPMLQKTGAVKV